MKKRILYAVATLFLLLIEVIIALYVHDNFIRPYVGDVLVVIVIYTFIRIIVPEKCMLIPLFLFIFAAGVELLQLVNIVGILGVADNKFLKTLMGSSGVSLLLLTPFFFIALSPPVLLPLNFLYVVYRKASNPVFKNANLGPAWQSSG